ncbi:MAG: bifunctional DNA primase/polymerase [Actinomycetota bacterium]
MIVYAALAYARRGWAVFPVHGVLRGACTCGRSSCSSPGKHPLTRRGLYDATTEQDVLWRWWRRWRSANVAVATGAASGIAVVDVDLPRARSSITEVVDRLPRTLTALTGGGGIHLVYACDRPLGNTAGRLPGHGDLPGIDMRADGGYVVLPPSAHGSGTAYSWLDPEAETAPLPNWIPEPASPAQALAVPCRASFDGDGSSYRRHVLRDEIARLGRAQLGRRNQELNRASFAVAQVVAGGELLEPAARAALTTQALSIGLTEHEVGATIESAFAAGSRQPRCAPHRSVG